MKFLSFAREQVVILTKKVPVQPVMIISSKWWHFRFNIQTLKNAILIQPTNTIHFVKSYFYTMMSFVVFYHSTRSCSFHSWWRHQMETFSALLAICVGNSRVPGEFPAQRPVTRSFDVFFDLRLNKRLSKQFWGWGFEMLPPLLWRQCNAPIV